MNCEKMRDIISAEIYLFSKNMGQESVKNLGDFPLGCPLTEGLTKGSKNRGRPKMEKILATWTIKSPYDRYLNAEKVFRFSRNFGQKLKFFQIWLL